MKQLAHGYTLRVLDAEENQAIWAQHGEAAFKDAAQVFRYRDALSPDDLARIQALGTRMGEPFELRLGVFLGNEVAGWSRGVQESADTYYMVNSAVLPAHQRKGLYKALIAASLEILVPLGFQRIYSRHTATNNAVIIPKLQAGFVITALEASDRFGTLVQLTYFPNAARRKVLDYRVGLARPDDEVRGYLGL
ncbi:MAG: hypothetical protein JWM80_6677 [Cyanobacteria bacterium RYN_339]|nr:hypothetical protein [Cyanobacteria bacterium RYN_339]